MNDPLQTTLVDLVHFLQWDYCETIAAQLDEALATDIASRIRALRGL